MKQATSRRVLRHSAARLHALALRAVTALLAVAAMVCGTLAQAAEELPVFQVGTSGDAVCTRCHNTAEKKPILAIHQTRHGVASQPGCQACHGSSRAHVQEPTAGTPRPAPDYVFGGAHRSAPELQSRTCLNCHKAGKRMHWNASAHPANDVSCAACHQVHRAQDPALARESQARVCEACHPAQRAQAHLLSAHPIAAGKTTCSDCHNPHGSTGPRLLVRATLNETCFSCHADKRGPFLWEHPPASDDCSICHVAHGSNIAPLLRVRPPWLCQSCHAGSVHSSPALSGRNLPQGAGGTGPSAQLLLRACTNCHSAIHGSNHPSGPRFTR